MKSYVKLFEEYLLEKDPLADLDLDLGDEKKKEKDPLADLDLDAEKDKEKEKEKKEDPFKKEKDAAKKKEERIEKKHDEYVDKKKDKIEDLLQDYPEVDKELGDKIIDAVNSQDRVKIHNTFNDLMALQIRYQKDGDEAAVNHIAKLKDQIDDLDKSYTDDKLM